MTELERQALRDIVFFCFERGILIEATGSRVIGGAREDSDYDYIIAEHSMINGVYGRGALSTYTELKTLLERLGFTAPLADNPELDGMYSEEDDDQRRNIYYLGSLNIILVPNKSRWNEWIEATYIAKKLSPPTKAERVAVFSAMRTGTPVYQAMDIARNGATGDA